MQTEPQTFYISTPIFYVNASPHIGHLYSGVLADVWKRWHDFKGYKTLFSTGTDEHGLKIQEAAEKAKKSPGELCDEVSQRFRDLFDLANISYTDYIRTTEGRHVKAVEYLWTVLQEKGHIYKGHHEGWYAVSDEAFVPENQVEETTDEKGNKIMVAKDSGSRVEWTKEENYKFRLTAFIPSLISWLESTPTAIAPTHRHREVLSLLRSHNGVQDLSVSRMRSRLKWGIPAPNDPEGHTIYVWLDALANYLTVTGYPVKGDLTKFWPADVHVVGKDIVKFHCVYWPAFLLAAGLPLPKQIVAHGHWTVDKTKMSKSRGNVVDPFELIKTYGVDPVRYYLMRDGGIVEDGEFSYDNLTARYRADLADNFGNLVQRCLSRNVNPAGEFPLHPVRAVEDARDQELLNAIDGLRDTCDIHVSNRDTPRLIQAVSELLSSTNKYFQDRAPWKLAPLTKSDPASADVLTTTLFYTYESLRVSALLMSCVMPPKMGEVLDRLGVSRHERSWENARVGRRWKEAGVTIPTKIPTVDGVLFVKMK